MSQWETEDDYDFEDETPPPPKKKSGAEALRAAYEKEKARRIELEEAVTKVQRDLANRTVKEVLTAQGADPRLARYVLNDIEDVDEDKVSKWLDENGDLFGYSKQDPEHVDEQRARQRADSATGSAPNPDGDALVRIQSATTMEDLQAAAKSAGIV